MLVVIKLIQNGIKKRKELERSTKKKNK